MNGWKLTAIIFIILFLIETIIIGYSWSIGTEIIENESDCAVNVCENYNIYYYDYYEKICYCYLNNEIIKSKYLGK